MEGYDCLDEIYEAHFLNVGKEVENDEEAYLKLPEAEKALLGAAQMRHLEKEDDTTMSKTLPSPQKTPRRGPAATTYATFSQPRASCDEGEDSIERMPLLADLPKLSILDKKKQQAQRLRTQVGQERARLKQMRPA